MKANHNSCFFELEPSLVLSIFQRYKMKANHNLAHNNWPSSKGAFNISKIQDESKSQHIGVIRFSNSGAFNISKIQDESKSQLLSFILIVPFGAFNISKIQDESKSQQLRPYHYYLHWCFQYFKDTR